MFSTKTYKNSLAILMLPKQWFSPLIFYQYSIFIPAYLKRLHY